MQRFFRAMRRSMQVFADGTHLSLCRFPILAGLTAFVAFWGANTLQADHCTDGDGDRFFIQGGHCGPVDCDDGNPNINPGAPELCDLFDNDCDGFVDIADANCSAVALTAKCALPFIAGRPGDDCVGKHQIVFETSGASPNAEVRAELLALDTQGTVLSVLPVQNGDQAHLASRLDPADFKASSKTNAQGRRHEMFAPIPMLRVTVNDGGIIAQAFCTFIPYLDVVEPSGQVVSEGDVTVVRAAIPFVSPPTLQVRVDGVDILVELGIDPATDFPGGPLSGVVSIGGQSVAVEDLVVRTSLDFAVPSENSLTMTLRNLGGGVHIIFLDGEPSYTLPPSDHATVQCHVDDVQDAATVTVLGINR